MDKLEETLIRVNNRLELNKVLKRTEGNIIGINVEDINLILQELKDTKISLNASNSIMNNLLDVIKIKDKMIDKMSEQLTTPIHDKEWVIKYYEERCKNAKD